MSVRPYLGFIIYDANSDGPAEDRLRGEARGNFVALNVSGLTLAKWNAPVDAPSGADDGGEKLFANAGPEVLPVGGDTGFARGQGFDFGTTTHGFPPVDPFILQDGPLGPWGLRAAQRAKAPPIGASIASRHG